MDSERLLNEAQLIAAEFRFFMVKGDLEHLYGYIYESEDAETKYALEIKYTEDFPDSPPEFIFPQPIPNVPDEIELETLNNWTSESHIVDAVRELSKLITHYVENPTKESSKVDSTINDTEKTLPNEIDKQEPSVEESEFITPNMTENPSLTTNQQESEQYLTPDVSQYPYEQDEYIDPDGLPQWTEEDSKEFQEAQDEQFVTPEPILNSNSSSISHPKPSYNRIQEPDMEIEPDVQVSTEAALIQQEYAIDYVGGAIGVIDVYLTITIDQTFIVRIDFSNYPQCPVVTVQENLRKILNDVNRSIDILKKWNFKKPKHIVELIREIESKLWFLSDIEQEMRSISGEYKTDLIDGLISHLRVSLFTYGFNEYSLDLDISKYPAEPEITFSTELQEILPFSPKELMAFKNWKRKESHVVDVLREVSWLVDKASRISFEVDLLKEGVKITYDKSTDSIHVELKGQLKTKDLKFEFNVQLQDDYPISAPEFKLLSELEGYEEIKEKIDKEITAFTSQWHPFNYLIDLFNAISKTIFAESIVSCVICHKLDCPECSLKISSSSGDGHDQCQTQCPSCERLYHSHCWNQTIISFGKCGFCLRPPPEHLKPQM